MNHLYSALAPENLYDFNRLLQEAEDFSEGDPSTTEETDAEKSPAQMEEDDVFEKVKQENDVPEVTNADAFLSKEEDGSYSSLGTMTSMNDPAIRGIGAIILGDIMTNPDNAVNYIDALFNIVGLNDVPSEKFNSIKPSIWEKLNTISNADPMNAFSQFQSFVVNLINQNRG